MKWLSEMAHWPVLAILIVAGCEQKYQQDPLACGPDVEKIAVTNDYAPQAIGATGGYQAWVKAKKLELDYVVTFYQPDGSFYLTEQHHEIYPWSNSIRISAAEPQGKLVWLLSQGRFSVSEGSGLTDASPITVENRCFAEMVLNITTAPARFLDKSFKFTKVAKPVKIEGRWYYSIVRRDSPGERANVLTGRELDWSKVVFYQNKDSSLVDMIWFAGADSSVIASEAQPSVAIPIFLAIRGYDYREIEKNGARLPIRIEIFKTNARGVLQERLVKLVVND